MRCLIWLRSAGHASIPTRTRASRLKLCAMPFGRIECLGSKAQTNSPRSPDSISNAFIRLSANFAINWPAAVIELWPANEYRPRWRDTVEFARTCSRSRPERRRGQFRRRQWLALNGTAHMSRYQVDKLLRDIRRDTQLAASFRDDIDSVLGKYKLERD